MTAYTLMIDADFVVEGAWRGRAAARRLVHECRRRSLPLCAKGIKIWLTLGQLSFFSNRVFPADGLGTPAGWKYTYPVHEVRAGPAAASLHGSADSGVAVTPSSVPAAGSSHSSVLALQTDMLAADHVRTASQLAGRTARVRVSTRGMAHFASARG